MEVSGQLHAPVAFTTRERAPGTHWIGGWVGPKTVLDAVVKRKIPSPRRESNPRTPIVQPVAQCYTDWAITAFSQNCIDERNASYRTQNEEQNLPSMCQCRDNAESLRGGGNTDSTNPVLEILPDNLCYVTAVRNEDVDYHVVCHGARAKITSVLHAVFQ
jgi:hypothetical protein